MPVTSWSPRYRSTGFTNKLKIARGTMDSIWFSGDAAELLIKPRNWLLSRLLVKEDGK